MSTDLVVKGNDLIEARYCLNTLEQKVLIKAISMIEKDDDTLKMYRFNVSEFINLLDIDNKKNIYTQLKEICKGLVNKGFNIKTENGGFICLNWVASAEYIPKEAVIEIEFSQKLKPLLLQLKEQFTTYYLSNIMQLKSNYSIRIFELLKQYQNLKTRVIELTELKKMLGIRDGEYELYGHFKSRVLLNAQKELKEKTDIKFSFKEIKENKRVVALEFEIKPNEKNIKRIGKEDETQVSIYIVELQKLFEEKTGIPIQYRTIEDLVQKTSVENVKRYIENWENFKKQDINNILGFFVTAVLKGYEIPKTNKKTTFEQRTYKEEELEKLYNNF